jgi:hypothetical protein
VNRFLLNGLLLLIGHSLFADTVYLIPSADTSLLEAFPGNNFGGQLYFTSGTTQNYTKNRGLLKFNIAGQIPANAKIKSGMLSFEVTGSTAETDKDNPSTFQLRRMLRDWGEGNKSGQPPQLGAPATTNEANWTYRFAFTTNTWGIPGGQSGVDYSTNSSGEEFFYGIERSPYYIQPHTQMTADIQSWLNQPSNNFGWMLLSQSEELNFSARRFGSSEDTNRAPILTVEYFVPRINQITVVSNSVELTFVAEAEQSYVVEYRDFSGGDWVALTNFSAVSEQTNCMVKDSLSNTQRFYRLSVP